MDIDKKLLKHFEHKKKVEFESENEIGFDEVFNYAANEHKLQSNINTRYRYYSYLR